MVTALERLRKLKEIMEASRTTQGGATPGTEVLGRLRETEQLATRKLEQARTGNLLVPTAYEKAVKYGLMPDVAGKTFGGRAWEVAKFPLQKLMSALYAFPRAGSAFIREASRGTRLGKPSLIPAIKEATKGFFNVPTAKYKGETYIEALKEIFPGMGEKFDWAEDWEHGPWYKKVPAALFGTPANIAGLALDIALDPVTYLTAGVSTGGRLGIKLSAPLITKAGKTVIPTGFKFGLKKFGKTLVSKELGQQLPKALKEYNLIKKMGVESYVSTYTAIKVTTKTGKKLIKGLRHIESFPTEDIAGRVFTQKLTEKITRDIIKKSTNTEALKILDLGGLKFAGKTIVPGFKLERTIAKPTLEWLRKGAVVPKEKLGKFAEKPIGRFLAKERPLYTALEKMFWTGAGIPPELKVVQDVVKAGGRYRFGEGMELLADITKGLDKAELDRIGEYMHILSDISRLQDKNKAIPAKLAEAMTSLKLSQKELGVVGRYQDEFVKNFLAKAEKELGISYKELADYYPSRYVKEPLGKKFLELGPKKATFEFPKRLSYLQAKALEKAGKIKPKTLVESSAQRLFESTTRMGRTQMLQEAKQFGKPFKTAGTVEGGSLGLKELKNWYFPKEYLEPLTRMKQTFFGDEAFSYTMNLLDKGVNLWKKLALFTGGYHGRNLYTDLQQLFMEYGPKAWKPRYWEEALAIQRQKHVMIESLGVYGDEAWKKMSETGIKAGGMFAAEAGTGIIPKGVAEWTPFMISRRAGMYREDMGRIVAGLIEKEAGSSWNVAASQVNKVLYGYMDITQFERQIRRIAIPFYIWKRKNIARQTELLFTRTGTYAGIPKIAKFVEETSGVDIEKFKQYRPEYMAELFAIMTPFKTKEGLPLVMNPNFAWQDWSRLSPRDMAAELNPLLRVPIELITGKEIFFNRPLREGKYVEAPTTLNWAKKIPDNVLENFAMKKGVGEEADKLFMTDTAYYLYRQNPLFYNLARLFPTEETPKTKYDWLSIFIGLKFFIYDEDKSKQQYYQRFINEVNKKIGQEKTIGEVIPTLSETKKPANSKRYEELMKLITEQVGVND